MTSSTHLCCGLVLIFGFSVWAVIVEFEVYAVVARYGCVFAGCQWSICGCKLLRGCVGLCWLVGLGALAGCKILFAYLYRSAVVKSGGTPRHHAIIGWSWLAVQLCLLMGKQIMQKRSLPRSSSKSIDVSRVLLFFFWCFAFRSA